jgi:hypothetical protein
MAQQRRWAVTATVGKKQENSTVAPLKSQLPHLDQSHSQTAALRLLSNDYLIACWLFENFVGVLPTSLVPPLVWLSLSRQHQQYQQQQQQQQQQQRRTAAPLLLTRARISPPFLTVNRPCRLCATFLKHSPTSNHVGALFCQLVVFALRWWTPRRGVVSCGLQCPFCLLSLFVVLWVVLVGWIV